MSRHQTAPRHQADLRPSCSTQVPGGTDTLQPAALTHGLSKHRIYFRIHANKKRGVTSGPRGRDSEILRTQQEASLSTGWEPSTWSGSYQTSPDDASARPKRIQGATTHLGHRWPLVCRAMMPLAPKSSGQSSTPVITAQGDAPMQWALTELQYAPFQCTSHPHICGSAGF